MDGEYWREWWGVEEAGKTKSLKDRQHQGMDREYWREWWGVEEAGMTKSLKKGMDGEYWREWWGGRRGREDQEPQGQITSRHGWGILEGMAGVEEAGMTKSLKDR